MKGKHNRRRYQTVPDRAGHVRSRMKALFRVLLSFIALAICFLGSGNSSAQNPSTNESQVSEGSAGADWPSHGGTSLSWRYSSLSQINTRNVRNLVPVWVFQTGDYQSGLQSTPIVVNGVLYVSAFDDVFAIEGATGKLIWQYKHEPLPGLSVGRNFGVAVADGKVFLGTRDAHVVALDQKTGDVVWSVAADDAASCRCSIQAAPLVVRDKIIVGESGTRGRISAFNIKSGHLEWRFYTIPAPGEKGHETWAEGDAWKTGSVPAWTTGSYDPELNLVYWGAGDLLPVFYGGRREGANLYSDSILALDADSGKLRWYYQELPHDVWDYDATWENVLIDRQIGGRMRKLLVQFSKSGFTFVLDRETGELLKTYPYIENYNWVKGIDEKGQLIGRNEPVEGKINLICPGNIGAKSWNQTAYSPRTQLIYVPALEMCNNLTVNSHDSGLFGGTFVFNAPPGRATPFSHLDAVDPISGQRVWTYHYEFELMASILATAGDLVFTGDPEGYFFALDARNGKKLWSYQTGAGHRGSAVTYMVGGRQYIATPTGWTSTANLPAGNWPESSKWRSGSSLFVFALPEEGK